MPMAMTYGAAAATTLSDREEAIARSVIYAGLFDYPLSLAQLRQTLIECVRQQKSGAPISGAIRSGVWSTRARTLLPDRAARHGVCELCCGRITPCVRALDLFSASQIVHLKPLSGAGVYQKLLAQNPFVLAWYPTT